MGLTTSRKLLDTLNLSALDKVSENELRYEVGEIVREARQATIITPFILSGAMAPVSRSSPRRLKMSLSSSEA